MKNPLVVIRFRLLSILLIGILFSSCNQQASHEIWLKGNLHSHTFWSDGDDFPENAARWYKDNGYDFLVFTDHNVLLEVPTVGPSHMLWRGQEVIDGNMYRHLPATHPAVQKYFDSFGRDWADYEKYANGDSLRFRLKTLEEFRELFEVDDEFLLVMGNEISDAYSTHFVAIHQDEVIPITGRQNNDRVLLIQNIVDRMEAYRERSGRNTWPILAHPNFQWAITAEMMLEVDELRFFEVYNGHPGVNNPGDQYRASTERIWDIVLSLRFGANNRHNVLYGVATDDTHNYHSRGATPGRGWVMVRSKQLSPEHILDAIDRGDFYSSTGVTLSQIDFDGKTIRVGIDAEDGVEYLTEFIGTKHGFDASSVPTLDGDGNIIPNTTRDYSDDIGVVLASNNEISSTYRLAGDELYVRIRITSSANQVDQITGEVIGKQTAWSQPYTP